MRKKINYQKFKKQSLYCPQYEHDGCGVGFVANINGVKSHKLIIQGIKVLNRLLHRGAVGADPHTGDGAGILIQKPHKFFAKVAKEEKIKLPAETDYAAGMVFLPRASKEYLFCKEVFNKIINQEGQILLGWRRLPLDETAIGSAARESLPIIEQPFIAKASGIKKGIEFERKLYIIRRRVEEIIKQSILAAKDDFYITGLSSKTFIYKGLLMSTQLEDFFLDLKDEQLRSAFCLLHSRYSTNTSPSWDLAQPFRYLAHNGEINTLRGNINWMKARESLLKSNCFGSNLEKVLPVINEGGSDSASLDNVVELLLLAGKPIEQIMTTLIPPAWENNSQMAESIKDFYQYHSCINEPWDGPAAVAFSQGDKVCAILDRNGLRPARYIVTNNQMMVMASEAGVLDFKPEQIAYSGRLQPGQMLLVDTRTKGVVFDKQLKERLSKKRPYSKWLSENLIDFNNIKIQPAKASKSTISDDKIENILKSFAYTREDLNLLIKPMAEDAKEPIGSMGNDTPHSVLNPGPELLYTYFKQLFAQVTNPAIDPIREKLVMSLESYLGAEGNMLEETPRQCEKIKFSTPLLTNAQLTKIKNINYSKIKAKVISTLFDANNKASASDTINSIFAQAQAAIKKGYNFIVLSDKGVNKNQAPLPILLVAAGLHHYLVRNGLRTQASIVLESGEPREVHHFAVLLGYGVDLVNPYLAFASLNYLIKKDNLSIKYSEAQANYIEAIEKGILKILSKMGISTLHSYRGAQIFEALGLSKDLIDNYFSGTVSRLGGIGFEEVIKEALMHHRQGWQSQEVADSLLSSGGVYKWRRDGEFHLWNPQTIASLQDATRRGDYNKYEEFAELVNNQKQPTTLRSLLKFKPRESIPVAEVEPTSEIMKRFATGAMSFGSISKEAHETLAIAMNRLRAMSNTGEGGEDPVRFQTLANGDSRRSAVKQVASGRFGVSTNYLVNADELQIKIAQGAKPGEGGHLPGHKVSAIIARTRYTTPGVTLISPPPHHDIYSIEDLKQLIFDLKNVNPRARISVKLVSEVGVGTIAVGVAKGYADMILISGADGGTGASPKSSIMHAGLPWELGLSETHQTLIANSLRSRVRLQTDGQMRTGKDVVIAAALGAEEFGFCTAALIVSGCVMLRHCNLNNCALGIATQDKILRDRFSGRPQYLINYFQFVASEIRKIMASLGIKKFNDLIGRTDLVDVNNKKNNWKSKKIDFSKVLYKPTAKRKEFYCNQKQKHPIKDVLDRQLIKVAKPALTRRNSVEEDFSIGNTNLSTGAMLSGQVCSRYGEDGLAEDTIRINFTGVAGQSFAAFLSKGVTFRLNGIANDYVGKGLFGGKIIISPFSKTRYRRPNNIIVGNTVLYGAVTGEVYIRGVAGERFAIRNSGAYAVVEGVGEHGCEYMTGGRVIVLGENGRNFAAGMSGGIAYIYRNQPGLRDRCNLAMVTLEDLDESDQQTIYNMLTNHYRYTGSEKASYILEDFDRRVTNFVKVMPREYKLILQMQQKIKNSNYQELDG